MSHLLSTPHRQPSYSSRYEYILESYGSQYYTRRKLFTAFFSTLLSCLQYFGLNLPILFRLPRKFVFGSDASRSPDCIFYTPNPLFCKTSWHGAASHPDAAANTPEEENAAR